MNMFYAKLVERLEDKKIRAMAIKIGDTDFDEKITGLFYRLNLPLNEGTAYISMAIKILNEEAKYYDGNSVIYVVARALKESAKNVNMCITHSIETAWLRMDIDVMTKIFGTCKWNKAPSNPEFITACVKFIQTGVKW